LVEINLIGSRHLCEKQGQYENERLTDEVQGLEQEIE